MILMVQHHTASYSIIQHHFCLLALWISFDLSCCHVFEAESCSWTMFWLCEAVRTSNISTSIQHPASIIQKTASQNREWRMHAFLVLWRLSNSLHSEMIRELYRKQCKVKVEMEVTTLRMTTMTITMRMAMTMTMTMTMLTFLWIKSNNSALLC